MILFLKLKIERFDVSDNSHKSVSLTQEEVAECIIERIKDQPYKKIVVWAGMIHFCKEIIHVWNKIFTGYTFCLDTSVS